MVVKIRLSDRFPPTGVITQDQTYNMDTVVVPHVNLNWFFSLVLMQIVIRTRHFSGRAASILGWRSAISRIL